MKRKRIVLGLLLSFLMFANAQAQDIPADSTSKSSVNQEALSDSLQALSSELAKIRSHVSQSEKDTRLEKIWKRKKNDKISHANPSNEQKKGEKIK